MSGAKRERPTPAAPPSPPATESAAPPPRAPAASVEALMEQADRALRGGGWFEAERLALKALNLARRVEDWDAMSRVTLPLQEARRLRLEKAFDAKSLKIVDTEVHDADAVAPGCYLVQPPLVGADARRLRLAALRQEVCAAVLCREPLTKLGLCPLVAIGAVTIRARIRPPKVAKKPTLEWFIAGMESLGDAAMQALDSGLDLDRQIDVIMASLDSVPDHEKLHQLLGESCRRATKGFERRLPPRLFADEEDSPDAPTVASGEE